MPAAKRLLALDLGSSTLRCLLFTPKGTLLANHGIPSPVRGEPKVSPLARSFPPQELWQAVCDLIRRTLQTSGVAPGDIAAVSATSQREGVALLDRAGKELYVGPNTDLRATFDGLAQDEKHGDLVYATTGHRPSFLLAHAKLHWLRDQRPRLFERTGTVLPLADWLLYRLSGERVSERALAAEAGLVDIRTGAPAAQLYETLGLPGHVLPALGQGGQRIGVVTRQAAKETGLKEGTPVALGGPDTQCGLLAMQVTPGQAGIVSGWSAPVQQVTTRLVMDRSKRLWSSCHVAPGQWLLESNSGEAGSSYRWLLHLLFGASDDTAHRQAEALAAHAPPGSGEVLCLLGAQVMDMNTLGLRLGGLLLPIPMTVSTVDKGQLVRAALENIAFAIRGNLSQLQSTSGETPARLSLGGGFARNRLFCRILADVLGRPIEVAPLAEVSGLGAAMCAATGADLYASILDAAVAMAPRMRAVLPSPVIAEEYNHYYARWAKLSSVLGQLGQRLL